MTEASSDGATMWQMCNWSGTSWTPSASYDAHFRASLGHCKCDVAPFQRSHTRGLQHSTAQQWVDVGKSKWRTPSPQPAFVAYKSTGITADAPGVTSWEEPRATVTLLPFEHLPRAHTTQRLAPPAPLTCPVRFTQADLRNAAGVTLGSRPLQHAVLLQPVRWCHGEEKCAAQCSKAFSTPAKVSGIKRRSRLNAAGLLQLQLLVPDKMQRWGNPLRAQHHAAFKCCS